MTAKEQSCFRRIDGISPWAFELGDSFLYPAGVVEEAPRCCRLGTDARTQLFEMDQLYGLLFTGKECILVGVF